MILSEPAILKILLKLQINNRGFAIEIVTALLGTPERQAGGKFKQAHGIYYDCRN